SKKAANEAKVELILDNSDKLFSVPGDIKIKRVVRKNGISFFIWTWTIYSNYREEA
ncbi:unnamed protein product, partial [marine sediment metagenome]